MYGLTFGPVPSRRLGRSLGINNIPPKRCSYSCVYCQLGRTIDVTNARVAFHDPTDLADEAAGRIRASEDIGEKIDYITFVPDGEPTLDVNLGKEILSLKEFGIRIAVISNASLIWRKDVQADLMEADWLSLKVDSVTIETWRSINRPDPSLKLQEILDGIFRFSKLFRGILTTETMLVSGIKDASNELEKTADYLQGINLSKAYISAPTRPPAEIWVKPPKLAALTAAYGIFSERIRNVELLTEFEGTEFAITGRPEEDIIAIASVHPIREDAMEKILKKAGLKWEAIETLEERGALEEVQFAGFKYYLKRRN